MFCFSIEPIHTVIIDCAPIGFMDAVGVKTMQQVCEGREKGMGERIVREERRWGARMVTGGEGKIMIETKKRDWRLMER